MYGRKVDDRLLTFAVSGLLWENSLVMVDKETNTQWSHLLGEAMKGPLAGQQLSSIPCLVVDWRTWKQSHPQTTAVLMSRTAEDYDRRRLQQTIGLLYGIAEGGKSRAWRINTLQHYPVMNDEFNGRKVVVFYDHDSGAPALFDRAIGETTYSFEKKDNTFVDRETGSQWSPITGLSITGPLKGKQLQQRHAILCYDFAWLAFHPESSYAEPGLPQKKESGLSIER